MKIAKTTKLPIECKCSSVLNKTLPYNGKSLCNTLLVFSFTSFDRQHALFNLGDDAAKPKAMSGKWFISLLDVLKEVCSRPIAELKNPPFELHPVNWKNANARNPDADMQREYLQFRISKSKGRIIGFKIQLMECVLFYVVWLDAHHNLTDSEGYGKAQYYQKPLNEYESLEQKYNELLKENEKLRDDLKVAEKLLEEK